MEGPLGTAILRWYFDIEEEASHLGSDIYLPAGRVYGTCGYFPMTSRSNVDGRGTSKREFYKQELRQMEVKYLSLKGEMDADPDFLSLDKFNRFQEMREIRTEAKKIKRTIDEECIREPTKDSLRLSRDQTVGLTQEGGICCKKQNGLSQEYHILGKFEVASIENREHSSYRDALHPWAASIDLEKLQLLSVLPITFYQRRTLAKNPKNLHTSKFIFFLEWQCPRRYFGSSVYTLLLLDELTTITEWYYHWRGATSILIPPHQIQQIWALIELHYARPFPQGSYIQSKKMHSMHSMHSTCPMFWILTVQNQKGKLYIHHPNDGRPNRIQKHSANAKSN